MSSNMLSKRSAVSMIIGCIAGLFLAVGISNISDAIGKGMLAKDLNIILVFLGIGIVLNLIAIIINKKDIYKVLTMCSMIMGLLLTFITLGFLMEKDTQRFALVTILLNGSATVISFGFMKLFSEFDKVFIRDISDKKEVDIKKFFKTVCYGAILINILSIILLVVGKVPVEMKHTGVIYQIVILVLNISALFGVSRYKKWAVYGLLLISLLSIGVFIWVGYSAYAAIIPFIGTLFIVYMFREMWNEFE